ncbi:MAG: SLBB domain-containing protein [gamma proteobacterium symbiont of Bathyaustriella thionipta]|nr:SLBB domain-containing protein [gamma proteobacterium symbiont of Bathyaustriella thionipta]MCU7948896.1 SLBB domain-containing protein [gamma proteobacterium symbiont of Bathyaustriella thionipta]MCU7953214.1 SLBB domain-containing protein [gamma proteobacterium symbiont of Bathyaustriella thionipta]MCU7955470.1 SLBB domain-containing protein [gamma proteobacterium symbiont of Bathyaustriella thionipta]MCU7966446.1 SLBB domain-containing protein [gamma proteobacterium symbiont of Bathyaustr
MNNVLLHPDSLGTNLSEWLSGNGGTGLEKALSDPAGIISIIKEADLRGLGGSGFPSSKKWQFVAEQSANPDKYLICNGNEDEPGTFKDAHLLTHAPHQVIEGALITALASQINKIVFYINPEQTTSLDNVRIAVEQWETCSLFEQLQAQLETPLSIRVMASSGHYIGGEETAAIESVEGNFPFPRGKPPFPAVSGVHGCPTLINNIETLANVPHILKNGAQWFRELGAGSSTGTKIYCLSGDVLKPGVYELPMGTPLSELIDTYGGGMLLDKKIKAVFTGGASSSILTPRDIDVPLNFESVKERGSSLGTGAMIVVSEGTGIVKRVTEYVNFYAHSSCGQCPPCKTGTFYISQLLNKIDTGQASEYDLESLINLCKILPGSGRCHLLDGAMQVIDSSLTHFIDEYKSSLRP